MAGDEAAMHSPKAIKRDFRGLGMVGIWSAGNFNSILPVVGSDTGRHRQAQPVNTWLRGRCHSHSFGAPEVIGAKRETGETPQRNEGCSTKKVTS